MRRPLKITLWSLGGLLLLLPLILGVALIAGNTDAGRVAIESLTQRLTGGAVRLSGLAGSFPSHLRLRHLQLVDDRGVWLSADQIVVDWHPAALFEDLCFPLASRDVDTGDRRREAGCAKGGFGRRPRRCGGELVARRQRAFAQPP